MDPSTRSGGDLILAIDAGTQSMRAALVDLTGSLVHLVKTPIEPYFSEHPGWAEQRPEYYWEMLCRTTTQLLAEHPVPRERLAAVALTTQRLTMVNVDRDGNPLRPAIVWLDERRADVRKVLSAPAILLAKAARVYPIIEFAVQYCRSNWIRQNQPEVWGRTHKFLFLSGFLTHRLTGELKDSTGNIIGTIPFDLKRFDWAKPGALAWRLYPLERAKLPDLVRPTELLGHVTAKASAETGIPAGLPMFAASNDKACDVIGSGCLTPDRASISFGTTATINTQNSRYVELFPMVPPYPSAVPGEYYNEVGVVRGLWLVSWFKEEFGLQERLQAEGSGTAPEDLLEDLIRDIPPGSKGLVCQPYWTPAPQQAPYAKGALLGFGAVHTRPYVYRAILEGIVYALKEGADVTVRKTGVPITEIRASGGGSRSDVLMQMTADVFDLPVSRAHTSETSIVGAAMDAAVGMGAYPDLRAAAEAMTRIGDRFEPIPANVEVYRGIYERVYRRTYQRLLPLYRDIQNVTHYPEL